MTGHSTNKILTNYSLLVMLVSALVFCPSVFAANASIYVAHSGIKQSDRALLTQIIEQLQKTKPAGHTIKQINTTKLTIAQIEQAVATTGSCVISIGELSLEKVLAARQKAPVFSILVKRSKLDNYISNYQRFAVPLTGIYHEQSFKRQLMLAKAVNSDLKNIGVLLGSKSRYQLTEYQRIANELELTLVFNFLKPNISVQNYFEKLPIDDGFLMILNDQEHYSTNDLQSLMLTSNRRRIPMLGAKPSDTVFAALASIYTPTSELAKQSAIQAGSICAGEPLPEARYASNYVVNINPHIANFLGYTDLKEEQLLLSIKSQEDATNNE